MEKPKKQTGCRRIESGSLTGTRKSIVNGMECRVENLDPVERSIRITVSAGCSIPYARRCERRVNASAGSGEREDEGSGREGGAVRRVDFSIMRISTGYTMRPPVSAAPHHPLRSSSDMESRAQPPPPPPSHPQPREISNKLR